MNRFNLSGMVTNAAPFSSISSGSTGASYYSAHGGASSSSSSNANLDYHSISGPFIASELTRYNLGGGVSYLNNRDHSLYNRTKTTSNYLVSITFDRCKITSVTCTCTSREYHLFWCEHVVALALHRIRKPLAVELRVPISESLLEFDREQLQKLLQYLIAEHHVQILPTVQRLVDELSHKRSSINLIAGAPDPTAGACVFGRHDWYLNEEKISIQVRELVKYVSVSESKQLIQLFYKPEDTFSSNDPFIYLWDHLTNLWIYIVTDINMSPQRRIQWREMFRHWSHLVNCPREDTYFSLEVETDTDPRYSHQGQTRDYLAKYDENHSSEIDFSRKRPHYMAFPPGVASTSATFHNRMRKRRILERALDATFLTWDDVHLQMILRQDGPVDRSTHLHFGEYFDRDAFPIWSEHLPTAAVRVASLRVNGHGQEALRLAMAIVRYLKHCQYQKQQQFSKHKTFCEFEYVHSSESWIGNPINPLEIIFDTLAEASLTPDSKSIDTCYALVGYDKKFDFNNPSQMLRNLLIELFQQYNEVNRLITEDSAQERPRYRHVQVAGSLHRSDTYLGAAVTVALIGLSQHRRSPDLDSQRDRTLRQEMRLIRKLLDIKYDSTLLTILQQQAGLLLEIGLLSDLVVMDYSTKHVPFDIAQIPGLVRFLFGALFTTDSNLAYDIGLRSLRFFKEEPRSRTDHERIHKPRIISIYLDLQLILAKTMLLAARNDQQRLELIFLTVKSYVNNAFYLNRLAYDVFQFSLNGRHEHLLQIAYAFGLHLTKITLSDSVNEVNLNRKQIIQWMVSCAGEIGLESILHLMQKWKEYFTPLEAVRQVASTVLSANLNIKICNHIFRQEELAASARKLAVECALQDPASCALSALSLCEKDKIAFDTISKVVEKAGAMCHMNAHQLFTVARYMEHQGVSDRACKIALLAASQVNIPLSADTHHLIGDLQWACSLAQGLGTAELSELIKILVKNVRCAPVLADMIRRCTFPPQPIHPSKHLLLQSSIRHSNYVSDSANLAFMDHSIEERMRRRQAFKTYPLDRPPLSTLLNAAVRAYIETVMKRLEHISPRHYSDFIEFLTRAQETIILSPDGSKEFATLLDKIKTLYKGKKKLMFLVNERFR
ncbi:Zinc finger SWIM domain-containing protein 6 [Blomia tropicalis]|nr:Zinc finger SWIM domain-containing protein 6 [Blomia tropicalis]